MDNAHTAVTLLPCPFCGSEGYTSESDQCWFVGCSNCYCNVGEAYDRSAMPDHIFGSEAEAITAWNARATTADLQARLDAAEKDEVESYATGLAGGRMEALAEIDRLTGGDGLYFASAEGDDCPDAHAMRAKILKRFDAINRIDAETRAKLEASEARVAELRAELAGIANRINIVGSPLHDAQIALDRIASEVKQSARQALTTTRNADAQGGGM